MYKALILVAALGISARSSSEPVAQAPASTATAFENARLIVGDGQTIDNGTFVVDESRLTLIGRTGEVQIPAGARRVDLTGKTVMPAIIDTHVHLSRERDALVNDLRRRERSENAIPLAVPHGVVSAQVPHHHGSGSVARGGGARQGDGRSMR